MTAIAGIIFAGISALCWLAAALIATPLPTAYLSGPPKWVRDRITAQSWCNGVAAIFAMLTAICQAVLLGSRM